MAVGISVLPLAAQPSDAEEFFETQVRPLLADNCYACHTTSKLGGLRLDSLETLLQGGQSGPAIIPGQPEYSLLMRAVRHQDERLKMPLGRRLEERQIETLAEWIRMGAPWPELRAQRTAPGPREFTPSALQKSFWSFQPIRRPQPPAVTREDWVRGPIDHFVLAKLEGQGLQPVGQADRRTMIRRASLDLIGLPPTPEEVDAFVNDPAPRAFENVVDRLLASPHYGERWGRYWLDVVRYGETDVRGNTGKGYESYPNAFRYRDWVIQAFNDDMPYDRFVTAQLAADFFPEGEREAMLPALGMLGLGPWYWDLTEPPIVRADERNDRVDVVTRGVLGVTVACARCHDHKYDSFSMHDYYALAGVFGNTRYHEYPQAAEEVVKAFHEHQEKIEQKEKVIKDLLKSQSEQLAAMLVQHTARYMTAAWKTLGPPNQAVVQAAREDGVDFRVLQRWVDFLSASPRRYPYLQEWDALQTRGGSWEEARRSAADFQAIVLSILQEKRENDEENQVRLADAPKYDSSDIKTPDYFQTYEQFCPRCDVELKSLASEKYFLWSDLMDRQEGEGKSKAGVLVFRDCELEEFLSPEWKAHLNLLRSELADLKRSLPKKYPFLHGVTDAEEVRELQLHVRGNVHNLGEEVPRRFPLVLTNGAPKPLTRGSGRLDLANAVVRHPLAARVIVNRIWNWRFGRGIVATPSNFGEVGARPTHPELLEYLASRLLQNGMSLKALHREIMLSATYQLSTEFSEQNHAKDADNRYLWRFHGRRLDAEALRDSLLFVSGALDPSLSGPSLEWNLENNRRSIYGEVSRFRLASYLALFDFPDPGMTSEARNTTLVPLQRLFFLNSDFVLKQADRLARRVAAADEHPARVREAYRILYGRGPSEAEMRLALDFLGEQSGSGDEPSPQWRQYARALLSANEFSFLN